MALKRAYGALKRKCARDFIGQVCLIYAPKAVHWQSSVCWNFTWRDQFITCRTYLYRASPVSGASRSTFKINLLLIQAFVKQHGNRSIETEFKRNSFCFTHSRSLNIQMMSSALSLFSSMCCRTNCALLDNNKTISAVYIIVDFGESNRLNGWSATRRDVTTLLDNHDFEDVEVEILDSKRFFQSSLFLIFSNHPAVIIYKFVREQLLIRIQDSIDSVWNFLSVFEVKRVESLKK